MSRLEEVNKTTEIMNNVIVELSSNYVLDGERITNMELASLVAILGDINISLAMIVDRMTEKEESEYGSD